MRHLSEETFADALEGGVTAASREHLRGCAECARRLAEAEEGLALARGNDMLPEPPAQYWVELRGRVRRRIAEPEPEARRPLRWLAPLAAAAAIVAAFGLRGTPPPEPAASAAAGKALPAWSALPPLEDDEAVPLLEGVLVSTSPVGWDEGRGADAYVAGLSDDESSSLAAALAVGEPSRRPGEERL